MNRILVVDDIAQNRYLLEATLRAYGYEVTSANDGAEALACARRQPPDLVITDILMPVMDGFTLCRQWREDAALRGIPFIFYTATYTDARDEQLAMDLGADRFVIKPQEPQVIHAIVQEVLARGALHSAVAVASPPLAAETVTLREYNEVLVRKLEKKVTELESTREALEADITQRRQAEGALLSSEQRFRALIEHSFDAISLVDQDGILRYGSPSATRITGQASEEYLGKSAFERIHPDDLPQARSMFAELVSNPGQTLRSQFRLRHKDESWIWLEATATNLLNQPAVRAVVVNYRDITERRRAEETLAASEARFRAIVERGGDAFFMLDANGAVTFDSPPTDQNLGYSEFENLGRNAFELVHSDDQQTVRSLFARLLQEPNTDIRCQFRALHRNGSWRWIDVIACNRLADPNLQGIVVSYRDITDRRRAEEESLRFGRILDDSLNEIYIFDTVSLHFDRVNVGAQRNLGYTMEELRRLTPLELKPEFNRKSFEALVEPLRAGRQERIVFEAIHRRKDGSTYPVEVHLQLANGGESHFFVAIIQDITARKCAEATLRESQQTLEHIVHSVDGIVWEADARTFQFSFISQQAERLLGYPLERWLTEPTFWKDHLHPQDRDSAVEFCVSASRKGQSHQFEYRMLSADGREVWLKDLVVVMVKDGEPAKLRGIMVDITEHKRAEEALRESEGQLRLLVQASNVGFWDWNLLTDEVFFSAEWKRQLGYADDELSNRYEEWENRLHPDDLAQALAVVSDFRAGRCDDYDIEFRLRHKEGSWRWILSRADILHDAAGQPIRMMGCHVDITERKQAEEMLRASQQRFATVFRSSPVGICVSKLADGTFLDVNDAFLRIVGHTREDVLGRSSLDPILNYWLDPEDRRQLLEALLETGSVRNWEVGFRRKDGTLGDSLRSLELITLDDEDCVLTILEDITERKQIEAALVAERNLLRTLVDHIPDFIFVKDTQSRQLLNNTANLRLIGARTDAEVVGKTVFDLYPREQAQRYFDEDQRAMRSGQAQLNQEESVLDQDGQEHWMLSSKVPLLDANGKCIGLVGIKRDITERKRAEVELAASRERLAALSRQLLTTQEAERRHLARELHDEIGQALTGIKLNLVGLQQAQGAHLHKPSQETIEVVDQTQLLRFESRSEWPTLQDTIDVVDQTLQQVRNLALDLRPSMLDDLGLVAALRWSLDRQSQRAGFAAQFIVEPADCAASQDIETACFRVVQECLTNIARHARARQVLVKLRQRGGELELLVRDDGIGFDVAAARGRAVRGESLGLLGMQERVQLVGGQMDIESAPALGTTIRARFPWDVKLSGRDGESHDGRQSP